MTARILGVAGGGLENATWAVNAEVAKIGQRGEQKTAAILNAFAIPDDGVTVMHDLHIPIPGFSANIDHVVVSGDTVHLIDAKVWKPARYWTLSGKTRRGLERFAAADKKTMQMAHDALATFLDRRGLHATFATPVLAIWPSSTRQPLKVTWLRVPGAKAMTGERFSAYANKQFSGRSARPANPYLVMALAELLVTKPRRG